MCCSSVVPQQHGGHAVFRPQAKVHPFTLLSHSLMWFTIFRRQIQPRGPQCSCEQLSAPYERAQGLAWSMWGTATCGRLGFLSVTTVGQVTKRHNCFLFFILVILRAWFICVTAVFISLQRLSQSLMNSNKGKFSIWSLRRLYFDFTSKGQAEP